MAKSTIRTWCFDFTGDDDVWVFIDDVLVLDLGGIHQALGGEINFRSGNITYDKTQSHGERPAATIAEAFSKAGEEWDSTAYKAHRLSFFYLERGDGGSNCKIKFNLPVKPSKAIDIEKETLGTIDAKKTVPIPAARRQFLNSVPGQIQRVRCVHQAGRSVRCVDRKKTVRLRWPRVDSPACSPTISPTPPRIRCGS